MQNHVLFVLTDGGRARFVERSAETGAFKTVEEIDNGPQLAQLRRELRASPPPRTFQSQGETRHAVGPEDYLKPAKAAFISQVAERATQAARERGAEALVLAAPKRLTGALREAFDPRAHVLDVIGKDLTKTPDHELGAWLGGVAHGAFGAEGRR